MDQEPPKKTIKIVLIGPPRSGAKTSLVNVFVNGKFLDRVFQVGGPAWSWNKAVCVEGMYVVLDTHCCLLTKSLLLVIS